MKWCWKKSSLLTLIVILFTMTLQIKRVEAAEENRVLFINSYSPSFYSFILQLEGLQAGLGEDTTIQVEFMDSGNFSDNESQLNFYNMIKYKMSTYGAYDAVVLGDDPAIDFYKNNKEELFQGMPIIFFGANEEEKAKELVKDSATYGILEAPPIKENVELISKLHSGKNIVAFTYEGSEECEELKEFYDLSAAYPNLNFKHISMKDLGYEDTLKKLYALNEDDILLEIYFYEIKEVSFSEIFAIKKSLSTDLNIPKYNTLEFEIDESYIGGRSTFQYEQAKKAGEIVSQLLKGETPKEKLIPSEQVSKFVFNYEELKKHNINEKELPPQAIIKNKPVSFWREYRNIIIPVCGFTLCLFLIIIFLICILKRRREYEKEILKAKEMAENAQKVQNNFISNISHELRTPVAVIMASNQLMKMNIDKSTDEKLKDNLKNVKVINQNCYRLTRIINNIIDLAKSDSGFMNLKLKNVEVISLIEHQVMSVIPYGESKKLNIIFDTDEEEVIMAVDPYKIERIVLNLLSNAIKFSKEAGIVFVKVLKNQEELVIRVEDNGIGITMENTDKIFEKFVQIDDIMKRKNEGSGIGLSLVKTFVKLHGGEVFVESAIDKGSRFTVKLPIKVLKDKETYIFNNSEEIIDMHSTEVEFSDIYF